MPWLLFLLVAAAGALGGCGGGSANTSETTSPAPEPGPAADPDTELTPAQICDNVERVVRADTSCMAMPNEVLAQCESRLRSELESVAGDPDALATRQTMFQCMGRARSCDAIDTCIDQLVAPPLEASRRPS